MRFRDKTRPKAKLAERVARAVVVLVGCLHLVLVVFLSFFVGLTLTVSFASFFTSDSSIVIPLCCILVFF